MAPLRPLRALSFLAFPRRLASSWGLASLARGHGAALARPPPLAPRCRCAPPGAGRPFGLAATTPRPKGAKNSNFPPRPKPPPEDEIEESFLKGSGPGGQKINKTNSAVQLKHLPTGLVVKCQATRSRSQNRTIARELLADRLDRLDRGDESRAAVVGEVHRRRKASSAKKSRRKYRKLDQEQDQQDQQQHPAPLDTTAVPSYGWPKGRREIEEELFGYNGEPEYYGFSDPDDDYDDDDDEPRPEEHEHGNEKEADIEEGDEHNEAPHGKK
ncbi:RF-1 domain-containing protein [Durotheca rogersii]|uniref:RF-1 domain-containing protein n=1 Tax=Durotheca rogersii TaxID=419775 RepID=UPI00221FE36B|nr:RF-1 domain-containing protein [Durotheca rogersii]KAI5862758.1 RF-1 domain-containing protein [Durotheca rogersii]